MICSDIDNILVPFLKCFDDATFILLRATVYNNDLKPICYCLRFQVLQAPTNETFGVVGRDKRRTKTSLIWSLFADVVDSGVRAGGIFCGIHWGGKVNWEANAAGNRWTPLGSGLAERRSVPGGRAGFPRPPATARRHGGDFPLACIRSSAKNSEAASFHSGHVP
jgi:hypothetical protein